MGSNGSGNYYVGLFAPKVRSFTVEDDGEKFEFFYKQPRADETLDRVDADKKAAAAAGITPTTREQSRHGIKSWIVHKDGSPINDDEADAIMAMGMSAFGKFTTKLNEIVGVQKPAAEGEAKNA